MQHKQDAIENFKHFMQVHELNGVQRDSILAAVLTTLQLMDPANGRTAKAALNMRTLNYAQHIKRLSRFRDDMLDEVRELGNKAVVVKSNSQENMTIQNRLYTLINSLPSNDTRAALVELLRIEPTHKPNMFSFMIKFDEELRSAYNYV